MICTSSHHNSIEEAQNRDSSIKQRQTGRKLSNRAPFTMWKSRTPCEIRLYINWAFWGDKKEEEKCENHKMCQKQRKRRERRSSDGWKLKIENICFLSSGSAFEFLGFAVVIGCFAVICERDEGKRALNERKTFSEDNLLWVVKPIFG